MKYMKTLGLLVIAAAALMAFVSTASATVTDGSGGTPSTFHGANSGNVSLTGPVTVTCTSSTFGGDITTNDANEASGPITTTTFTGCGNSTITITQTGTMRWTDTGSNAVTYYSSGLVLTALLHTFFGTVHCTAITDGTVYGTLTGTGHASNPNTGAHFDLSATIPVSPITSDVLCEEEDLITEGTEVITNPSMMRFD